MPVTYFQDTCKYLEYSFQHEMHLWTSSIEPSGSLWNIPLEYTPGLGCCFSWRLHDVVKQRQFCFSYPIHRITNRYFFRIYRNYSNYSAFPLTKPPLKACSSQCCCSENGSHLFLVIGIEIQYLFIYHSVIYLTDVLNNWVNCCL